MCYPIYILHWGVDGNRDIIDSIYDSIDEINIGMRLFCEMLKCMHIGIVLYFIDVSSINYDLIEIIVVNAK